MQSRYSKRKCYSFGTIGLITLILAPKSYAATVYCSDANCIQNNIASNTEIILENDISLTPQGDGNTVFSVVTGGITGLIIDGNGYTVGFPSATGGNGHVFVIAGAGTSTIMTIKNMNIKNAYDINGGNFDWCSTCSSEDNRGGAIYNAGELTLQDVTFTSCTAFLAQTDTSQSGGGAIYNTGTLYAYDTTYTSCSGKFGGAIFTTGTATFYSAMFADNECTNMSPCTNQNEDIYGTITCYSSCLAPNYGISQGLAIVEADAGSPSCTMFSSCSTCPAGTFLSDDYATSESECTSCGSGQISEAGSKECTSCAIGKYASNDPTESGGGLTTQVSLGATVCNSCPPAYKGIAAGSIVCVACSEKTSSIAGSSTCELCNAGYYEDTTIDDTNENCIECGTEGFTCDSVDMKLTTLKIDPSYFRISELSYEPAEIRPCPMGATACAGGRNFSDNGNSYCNEGYYGPLCNVCVKNYFYDAALNSCEKCENSTLSPPFIAFIVIVVAITFGVVLWCLRRTENLTEKVQTSLNAVSNADLNSAKEALDSMESGKDDDNNAEAKKSSFFFKLKPKLKIMIVFAQLVSQMGFNLSFNEFPTGYAKFLSVFEFANLNLFQVIPFECLRETAYYTKLFTTTMLPLVIGLIILLIMRFIYKNNGDKRRFMFSLFLSLAYLVLPSCSSTILSFFKCDYFQDNETAYMQVSICIVITVVIFCSFLKNSYRHANFIRTLHQYRKLTYFSLARLITV